MAFDEKLAGQVRRLFEDLSVPYEEKRMMGGLCFMVDGKMCVGVHGQRLMARIDPDVYESALSRKGCTPMDFTGRPMRGFVFVGSDGLATKRELESWLRLALEFNPRAVSSKTKQRATGKKTPAARKRSR
jgi:TfoX/Sxy family transcriptional regulator of competence genes